MLAFSSQTNLPGLCSLHVARIRKTQSFPQFRTPPLQATEEDPLISPKSKLKKVLQTEVVYATMLGCASSWISGQHHHMPDMCDVQHATILECIEVIRGWSENRLPRKKTVVLALVLPLVVRYAWVAFVEYTL